MGTSSRVSLTSSTSFTAAVVPSVPRMRASFCCKHSGSCEHKVAPQRIGDSCRKLATLAVLDTLGGATSLTGPRKSGAVLACCFHTSRVLQLHVLGEFCGSGRKTKK